MYKIMIVDDEAYFRQYLRETIPWQEYEFQICDEACNGEEGLEKIPSSRPDIILVDISMPVINGLEFSKIVKDKYPFISIILITGYNEFEYARQAVKIGVANYISKPFEKQELVDTCLSLKRSFNERQIKDTYINTLEKHNSETRPILQRSILFDMVRNKYSDIPFLQKELASLGIVFLDTSLLVSVIEINNSSMTGYDDPSLSQLLHKITSIINQILDKNVWHISFEGEDGQIVLITGIKHYEDYKYIVTLHNEMIMNTLKKLGITITIGIGIVCTDLHHISQSYDKACIALRNKFLLGEGKVIEFNSLKIQDANIEVFPFKFKNDLLMYLRLADKEKIQTTLNKIYSYLHTRKLSIDYVYILYTELLYLCFSYIAEQGYNSEDIFGANFYPFKQISEKKTIKEVHEYICLIYIRIISYLATNKKNLSLKIVARVKDYIDKNYSNSSLTINLISANIFFHPSYLRFLFKKETGITIGEYLTEVRMARAKELLKNGGVKFSEVALMSGYSDAAYFSKCFKKYYNISPSEYEKSIIHQV